MKIAHTLTIPVTIGLVALAAATALATEGVSPGAVDRMAQVNNACPTFSWEESAATNFYEIVAYAIHENDDPATSELTAESEVLYSRISGAATSWTPSAEQCFAPGGRYVWFVRAVNELAGDEVVAAGEWSEGRYFTVPAAPSAEEVQRALDVLRRWDAANGGGSLPLSADAGAVAVPARCRCRCFGRTRTRVGLRRSRYRRRRRRSGGSTRTRRVKSTAWSGRRRRTRGRGSRRRISTEAPISCSTGR